MDLVNLVYNILSPLNVPVLWQLRPKDLPGITYHFFNENGELYGEGEEVIGGISCQIDIWSKTSYTTLSKQAKAAMKKSGFYFVDGTDNFEEGVNIYHKVLIFNYYYESEVM